MFPSEYSVSPLFSELKWKMWAGPRMCVYRASSSSSLTVASQVKVPVAAHVATPEARGQKSEVKVVAHCRRDDGGSSPHHRRPDSDL